MWMGIKIVSVWITALVLGLTLRAILPNLPGLHIMRKGVGFVFPMNRLAFWVCVMTGFVAGAILMVKAMLRDLGLNLH